MTPPESPSSLLERAADRLEELAGSINDYYGTGQSMPLPNEGLNELAVVMWQIAMSPSVAPPLVAWLRAEARFVRRNHTTMHGQVEHLPSMRFARQVLGEETS